MRVRYLWLCALYFGCAPAADPLVFPDNACRRDADCWEETRCFKELSVCGRDDALTPYRVVLQVTPNARDNSLIPRVTFPSLELTQSDTERTLEVPNPLPVQGNITAQERSIHAEVTFRPYPEGQGYPTAPVSVTSISQEDPSFTVLLPPRTSFEVYIRPLGKDSTEFPPVITEFRTEEESTRFEWAYPTLLTLARTLVNAPEGAPLSDHWVRLRHTGSGRIISSMQKTDAEGRFTLTVMPADNDAPSILERGEYVLQVDLNKDSELTEPKPAASEADARSLQAAPRWREVIEVPPGRITGTSTTPLVLPRIPARVVLTGSVEMRLGVLSSNAELTFVSRFPVPTAAGDLRDRDWCRSPESKEERPPFVCLSSHSVSTNTDGRFEIALLPGDYDVFIAPGPDDVSGSAFSPREEPSDQARPRFATVKVAQLVETQPGGGVQGPSIFELESAKLLTGVIRNGRGKPLPNMIVRSVALGLRGLLGEVALYNRSSNAVTDAEGRFSLALDKGYYDVVGEPPAGSGYPLLYYANRQFDPDRSETGDRHLTLQAPVILAGTVVNDKQEPLSDVSIDAFAIVPDLRNYERAVLIGQAVSDAEGRYMLTLPPEILLDPSPSP